MIFHQYICRFDVSMYIPFTNKHLETQQNIFKYFDALFFSEFMLTYFFSEIRVT